MTALSWQTAAVTDRGVKRSENQDNFYISPDDRVFVVADGMGGELGGATASRIAVQSVDELWKHSPPDLSDKDKIHQWLVQAVSNANSAIFSVSAHDPTVHGMGTTIVVAVQSDDNLLHIAHVGDSRAYLLREGKTVVLTQDHSVVMDLLLAGKISLEQFKTSPFRSYITRCVGHNTKVEIDKTPVEIRPGDSILLCTDGLTAVLDDEEIGEIATVEPGPEPMCKSLVQKTLDGGAPDNVTVIAICYATIKVPEDAQAVGCES